jgi:hypothetical protein
VHTHAHTTRTQSTHSSKTVVDYFISNRKLSELFIDVRVYRGGGKGSDHFLTFAKLRFPPKCYIYPRTQHTKKIYFIIQLV